MINISPCQDGGGRYQAPRGEALCKKSYIALTQDQFQVTCWFWACYIELKSFATDWQLKLLFDILNFVGYLEGWPGRVYKMMNGLSYFVLPSHCQDGGGRYQAPREATVFCMQFTSFLLFQPFSKPIVRDCLAFSEGRWAQTWERWQSHPQFLQWKHSNICKARNCSNVW